MHEFLSGLGAVLFGLGVYLVYSALGMDPTVSGYGPEPVANMQLMHIQMMSLLIGLFVSLSGLITVVAGLILGTILRRDARNIEKS